MFLLTSYYTAERFELSFLLILRFYFIFLNKLNPKITILHFVLKTYGQWLHCVVPLEVHSVTQEESQEIRAHMQTTLVPNQLIPTKEFTSLWIFIFMYLYSSTVFFLQFSVICSI